MQLTKRIPVAAGLGGGSSDAAGALVGLARLWSLDVPRQELAAIALSIGSDVPYFLRGGRQNGLGRGEILTPVEEGPEQPVLLVVSRAGLSTRRVFEEHARQASEGAVPDALTSRKTGINFLSRTQVGGEGAHANDLLRAAVALDPSLGVLMNVVRREVPEGQVGLTGSGPTLFILLEPGTSPADVRERLAAVLPETVALCVTRTMGVAEHDATRFTQLVG
jgi:4-diphosphocytidyl-2-C-methyl-D-erythritol kinase